MPFTEHQQQVLNQYIKVLLLLMVKLSQENNQGRFSQTCSHLLETLVQDSVLWKCCMVEIYRIHMSDIETCLSDVHVWTK